MKSLDRFRKWVKSNSCRRGIICHFYISEAEPSGKTDGKPKQKQYYSKTDYAFFNLFSPSKEWIVKGTIHHGVTDKWGDQCRVPCLNCFEVDETTFCKALEQLGTEGNRKFEVGLLLNKRKLRTHFGQDEVHDVEDVKKVGYGVLPNKECWKYDIPSQRVKVLQPFHFCDVVRVRIPKSRLRGLPIYSIPIQHVMGLLVRRSDYHAVLDMPKVTEFGFEVFPVL
jgi:hypothetical protein